MKNENYDRTKLAKNLRSIIKDRTLKSVSEETGVSLALLSRLVNEKADNVPKTSTLKKLSRIAKDKSESAYEILLDACGYNTELYINNDDILDFELKTQKIISVIINAAMKKNLSFQFNSDFQKCQNSDFVLTLNNEKRNWSFKVLDLNSEAEIRERSAFDLRLLAYFGELALNKNRNNLYSLITTDRKTFDYFSKNVLPFNFLMTIVYVDLESLTVIDESVITNVAAENDANIIKLKND